MKNFVAADVPLPVKVKDVRGRSYTLQRRIGYGGQGAVFETRGGAYAVKLLNSSSASRDELRSHIDRVRRLPLQDLAVARPLELLSGSIDGYVMSLMAGLEPWSALLLAPDGVGAIEWHRETGGLRRRYELAEALARLLAGLADRGLVYGDLSYSNVLITTSEDSVQAAWLIDLDNLRLSSQAGEVLYTNGCGAPEVVRKGAPLTTLTDAWSLAVLAFWSLTLIHPFVGDSVDSGPPEREDEAYAGILPWVDDPSDRSNAASDGLRREAVLTTPLRELFHRCFGSGRDKPLQRPGAGEIAHLLHEARWRIVQCSACGGESLYKGGGSTCIYCNTGHDRVVLLRVMGSPLTAQELQEYEADPRRALTGGVWLAIAPGQTLTLPQRMLSYGQPEDAVNPALELTMENDAVRVRPLADIEVSAVGRSGNHRRLSAAGRSFRIGKEPLEIRIGNPDEPHKYLIAHPSSWRAT